MHACAGLLESVSDLTVVSINSTTVLISWSPPFTLEGVPILGYNVTITNTTSEENETILETVNTTMLNYTFSIDHPDTDSEFIVTVVPINEAGPGGSVTTSFSFSEQNVIKGCLLTLYACALHIDFLMTTYSYMSTLYFENSTTSYILESKSVKVSFSSTTAFRK